MLQILLKSTGFMITEKERKTAWTIQQCILQTSEETRMLTVLVLPYTWWLCFSPANMGFAILLVSFRILQLCSLVQYQAHSIVFSVLPLDLACIAASSQQGAAAQPISLHLRTKTFHSQKSPLSFCWCAGVVALTVGFGESIPSTSGSVSVSFVGLFLGFQCSV